MQKRALSTRHHLIEAATELIRRNGFGGATVDHVCSSAKVSKGAFFHHFASKEELVEACLAQWDARAAAMEEAAPFQRMTHPRDRVLAYMDFYIALFKDPKVLKSCLAGTTVQEVGNQIPALRKGAHACFANAADRLQRLLDLASTGSRKKLDTGSLARLWVATLQGALILSKASQDPAVVTEALRHVRHYIAGLLPVDR